MAYSYRSVVDGGADSDIIYYNAQITASQTTDLGTPVVNTNIRFNESRDASIIKDASLYEFSIIRFAMNGPGKNLPLFIPLIQTNGKLIPNQQNPNLTVYYVSISYDRNWNYTDSTGAAQIFNMSIYPTSTPIRYITETQNQIVAPIPIVPATGITKQDLSSRYYWVYTYSHWVQLVNNALIEAHKRVYDQFVLNWQAFITDEGSATPNPYPTFQSFLNDQDIPSLAYDPLTGLFEIYGDTRCFNVSGQIQDPASVIAGIPNGIQPAIPVFTPSVYTPGDPASPASNCYMRLFFNDLLFGLFANFNNTYLGINGGSSNFIRTPLFPAVLRPFNILSSLNYLYTNEILFSNKQYTNFLNNNPNLQNIQSVPPPIYNPFFLIPTEKQNLYWITKQDYVSTDSLWSPISSIVFTSTLLPLKKEYTASPILLGATNAAGSSGSPSSFEPIICDVSVDTLQGGAEGYRNFTLYEPKAEYRMVSMTASHEEIRNIDVQVFWKYRLTGDLYPITMFNCSDVSIKMMFRKTDYYSTK